MRARIYGPFSHSATQDRQRTADAGFDAHLTKPANPGQIQRLLDEVAARVHD